MNVFCFAIIDFKRFYIPFALLLLLINLTSYGQVGINTTNPNATLDVRSSNQAAPANNDGIIIPKIDNFPIVNPTVAQQGMLVFLTTDNTFYYWDNSITTWTPLSSGGNVDRIDDLLDGKSDFDGTNNGSSVFLGINAGANDDESNNKNTGFGFEALISNTTGENSVAIGYKSLAFNITGNSNIAIGSESLSSNTIGSYNLAFGQRSLASNINGSHNIATGIWSLASNTTGDSNIATGTGALQNNTTGDSNIATGYLSLYANKTGYGNIASGTNALSSNITGFHNLAIGGHSLWSNTIGEGNIAIGVNALRDNISGIYNVATGSQSLHYNTSGYYNIASGYRCLYSNTTGSHNTAIGAYAYNTSINFTNSTALGYNAEPGASNTIRLGNNAITTIGGFTNWTNVSDGRFKKNIKENVIGLKFIKELRPVTYQLDMNAIANFNKTPDSLRLKNSERIKEAEIQSGFIAQEVEQVAKNIGYNFSGVDAPRNETSHYGLRYATFVVPLVKAVQEQQEIIETYNIKIEHLETQLKNQQKEIEAIKALLEKP